MITDMTLPATEPISLATAKLFLRIDHGNEDSLITDFIRKAREQIETLCRQTLISRSQRLTFPTPLKLCLYLNIAPIKAVTAVTLHLESGATESLDLSTLDINLLATPVSIKPKTLGLFGYHTRADVQAITVDITAGYGEAIEDVPMPLRQAMLLLIGQSYENRSGAELPAIPMMVDALVMPYRSLKL